MGEGPQEPEGFVRVDDDGQKWGEDEFGEYRIQDRAWTMNEIRDHPMFMEDVPQDISDNPELLALQSLVYDGQTPEELAEHFKNLGNEAFRTSTNKVASQNALLAYSKGLEMECKDNALNAQLHSNRAAVSIRLQEFAKAIDDCRKAVKLDPTNLKAHYRGAKASETIGLTQQAIKFCDGALGLKSEDKELLQMRKKLQKQLELETQQHRSRRQAEASVDKNIGESRSAVQVALGAREVELGPILFDLAMYFQGRQPMPTMVTDGEDAVQWPLLQLYDETCQSDYVEVFDERCSLNDQFKLMFPEDRRVDWDEEGKYVWNRLVAYLEVYSGSNNKCTHMQLVADNDAPLRDALTGVRVPQVLTLHILVRGSGALESFCIENHLKLP